MIVFWETTLFWRGVQNMRLKKCNFPMQQKKWCIQKAGSRTRVKTRVCARVLKTRSCFLTQNDCHTPKIARTSSFLADSKSLWARLNMHMWLSCGGISWGKVTQCFSHPTRAIQKPENPRFFVPIHIRTNCFTFEKFHLGTPKWNPSSALRCVAVRCSALQCIAVRCSALQCVAVRCCVLQCVAVNCNVSIWWPAFFAHILPEFTPFRSRVVWRVFRLFHVTWLHYMCAMMCAMIYSYVTWPNPFACCVTCVSAVFCVTWLNHIECHDSFMCDMTIPFACGVTCVPAVLYMTWLIYMWATTHAHVWHDSHPVCVRCDVCSSGVMCDMTHSYVCHDSCICVIWLPSCSCVVRRALWQWYV